MCGAQAHVRFTPNSDRESGFPQTVMSALPPKADMCSAVTDVCLGPIADTQLQHLKNISVRALTLSEPLAIEQMRFM